jgi:hypothetical protein
MSSPFTPNWSPTAYYVLGDTVFYIDTRYRLIVAGSTPGVFGVPPPDNGTAWEVFNTGVISLGDDVEPPIDGNVILIGGPGIGILTDNPQNGITITNNGVLSLTASLPLVVSSTTGAISITSPSYLATYYKSAVQNLVSGPSDVTFDSIGSWSNEGHITRTSATDFTVSIAGVYQLEFNTTILQNGATWSTTVNRSVSIDVTRSPSAEVLVVVQSALIGNGNYAQAISGTFNLLVGDVINLRVTNTFVGGPAQVQCIQGTADLNTFFTWTFIR